MNATNALENLVVDHLFRSATWAKPSALWAALFTAAPSDAGGGTEVIGGGYARVNVPPGDANWTATQGGTSGASTGTGGVTANAATVTFPVPSADWGTVTHIALFTAATGGTPLVWAALTASRSVRAGDPAPTFPPNSITITVA